MNMQLPSLIAVIAFSALAPAFALTDADITPAALVGKTLTFTIANGGAPYATTGTWSGAFAASGNGFAVANITGDTVAISTTYTAAISDTGTSSVTNVTLAKFIEGQQQATLILHTSNGFGNYELFIDGVFRVSLNGVFTLDDVIAKIPEIDVQQPVGTSLQDGVSRQSFPRTRVRKTSVAKRFKITNTGTGELSGLRIRKIGTGRTSFIVKSLATASLASGESTSFSVRFRPRSRGVKSAAIRIYSNDADERPFDIRLVGRAK